MKCLPKKLSTDHELNAAFATNNGKREKNEAKKPHSHTSIELRKILPGQK